MFTFQQKMDAKDIELMGCESHFPVLEGLKEGKDYEVESVNLTVEWHCAFETRDWGIKSSSAFVTNITGDITFEIYDENGNTETEETVEFNYGDFKTASIENDIQFDEYGQLQVTTLGVYFQDMTLSVS